MEKLIKSGIDLTVFSVFSFLNENDFVKQFLVAIAGAIGIAFANYILLPFLKYLFKKIKEKINGSKLNREEKDKLLDFVDETEKKLQETIDKTIDKIQKGDNDEHKG